MNVLKRWLCLALSLALSAALVLPAGAADPLSSSFADFLIDASALDAPSQDLHVFLYRRNGSGTFAPADAVKYSCSINRAANATFYIKPQASQVWLEVNYLTDLNFDGIYELLDGENLPVHDLMTADGRLVPRAGVEQPWSDPAYVLSPGTTYALQAETLRERGLQALQARCTTGNIQALSGLTYSPASQRTILYLITLHYLSPQDQKDYTLNYYLSLYDNVIIPSDVPANAWYYETVEYALSTGLFSGTGRDTFSPEAPATRAMIWTVLAKLKGAQLTAGSPWYAAAQGWAMEKGVSDGSNPDKPVTREQLVQMLYVLAAPKTAASSAILSAYPDSGLISGWAREAMAWGVEQGILSGRGNGRLDPQGQATRAEVAAMLRQYIQRLG